VVQTGAFDKIDIEKIFWKIDLHKEIKMIRSFNVLVLAAVMSPVFLPVRALAQDVKPLLGTWLMKPAEGASAAPASEGTLMHKIDPVGKGFHFVEQSSTGTGFRIEYTVESFDGKDYPWKATGADGKPMDIGDAIAFKRVDDNTYQLENKKAGKVTMTQTWVLSNGGKTRTVTMNGRNGPRTSVFEKQ
jgi:hypothetical protein